jgi:hypothetical protein
MLLSGKLLTVSAFGESEGEKNKKTHQTKKQQKTLKCGNLGSDRFLSTFSLWIGFDCPLPQMLD